MDVSTVETKPLRICYGMPLLDGCPGEAFPHHLLVAAVIGRMGDLVISTPLNKLPHDRARAEVIEFALEHDCDYLFFGDDDTISPSDAVPKLLEAMKEHKAAVVSGHYYRRGWDYTPVWSREVEGKYRIVTAPEGSGVVEIHCSGLGCALIDLKFVRERLKAPYFEMGHDGRSSIVLDDVSFFRKVRAAGGLILGHSDVRCGHLGERKLIDDRTVSSYAKWEAEQLAKEQPFVGSSD